MFLAIEPKAGTTDLAIFAPIIDITANNAVGDPAKKPIRGFTAILIVSAIAWDRSVNVAANCPYGFVGIASAISPNFFVPWVMISFVKAIRFSKFVTSAAVLPIVAAKSFATSSRRIMIPNSSTISDSSFAAPLVRRSIASVKSLPRALEAPVATLASPSICSVEKPALVPNATDFIASAADSAPPDILLRFFATSFRFRPPTAPVSCRP